LADELCHSFYWGLKLDLISYRGLYLAANLLPKKIISVVVCVCVFVMLQMIDDTDLGFFANFLGICIFVLVVAYHYVVADPKYEVH
jgi:hypothetical protein